MYLSDYQYFLRIVEYGSITKAAESLYISQPSLTKYLHKLEDELGVPLFERKKTPLRLTDAGHYFYDFVKRSDLEQQTLLRHFDEIRNEGRSTITVGINLWRSSVLMPDFMTYFSKRHPLIHILLREASASVLEQAIINDDITFAILNLPVNYSNTTYIPIADEHVFLIGSRKNELIRKLEEEIPATPYRWVDIRRFTDEPFILNQKGQYITECVNNLLSRQNLSLNCLMRTANVTTAVNLAASDVGFAFVPELGTQSRFFPKQDLTMFTLGEPILSCSLAAVCKKGSYLPAAAQTFIEELHEFVRRTYPSEIAPTTASIL